MTRTSFYDRISEIREAAEAFARQQAEEAANAPPVTVEPEPEPVTPLRDTPSSFSFGGFELLFPEGFSFRDIQTTIEHEGEPVVLNIKRRDVHEGATVEGLVDEAMQTLCKLYPELRIIRKRSCTLAGSAAQAVDFHFNIGHAERHGRLVGGIVPVVGKQASQWVSISCVIDPARPGLSLWLIDFDNMLSGMAAN
ncbi:hypothetical protein [Pseudomonas sp. LS-2]|jgi:hypothetical protein|uniref:hypothetical protein n=1 Tax=Pseudomonas sp. LS-2 TaxID=2315859 RepID=UPI000E74470B|nr:hypothetical protein [Pseudomonas sp. LS-2]RJX82702.1 hypothetical protein D3M70_05715 [Pseudomonas sp. LS-2]